ncbi:YqeG family HAD IIIA-type phosphatase [Thermus sp.]|uniref:YqeG family HAD IIIA-type phosphatase n=1 Tax=Thermus sp. TaxID=275 RepID=UPI00307F357A
MLRPKAALPSLLHLTPAWLRERGLKGVILDLDNTLLPYGEEEVPEAHLAWLEELRRAVPVYLLSNALPERFARIQNKLGLPGHAPALKPWAGFRKALKALGLPAREVAVVGDQVFTDILGGNLLGAYTVLVPPLREQEFFYTRFIRLLETPFRRPWEGTEP